MVPAPTTAARSIFFAGVPAGTSGIALPEGVEHAGVGARRGELVVHLGDLLERPLLGDDALGEGDRAGAQVVAHDLVDDAHLLGPRGPHGIAADDHLERSLDSGDAWQALGPARPGQKPKLDLGQAHLPRSHGDAVVAREADFEAAPERRAVNGRDDGLGAAFDGIEHAVESRRLGRLAELADVGARDEGAAAAYDDHGADAGIGQPLGDPVQQSLAHALG